MRNRIALLSTAACLAFATGVQAQSVNYGQLEQFFGEPVTTSATGSPQKATDAPANMEIINADDIRRSGATNLPDVLRFISGIDVRQYSNGQTDVSVRGYGQASNPRLLVLVNGRQVYSDDFGYTAWDTIPVQLEEIRQIEVIRGPNSALFGFNAVGGVINIITFDPLNDSAKSVTARGGTDGYGGGSAVGTFHIGDQVGLRLSAGGYRADESDPTNQPGAVVASNGLKDSPYARSFSADGRVQLTSNVLLTAELTSSQSAHDMLLITGGPMDTSVYVNNSGKVGVEADTSLGLLTLDAYRNQQHFSVYGTGADFYINDVSYVVQANDLFKIGTDHTVRVGVEYRNNEVLSDSLLAGSMGYEVYAASAMWNWQIAPTVALTNSVRIDHLTLNRSDPVAALSPYPLSAYDGASLTVPSYNSGLVYKASDNDTIRLLASQGVQAPSILDFGTQLPIKSGTFTIGDVAGNPDVNPARVSNYEIDYDRAMPSLNSTLRTAFFYQKTQDLIAPAFQTSPIYLRLTPIPWVVEETRNIGSSSAAGGEIGIKGQSGPWRWNASYSLVDITDHINDAYSPTNLVSIGFAHGSPTSIVIGGLGYTMGKWEIDGQARWQSGYTDFATNAAGVLQPYSVKDYVTTNLRVGYNILDSLQAAVTGQQLNESTIVESAGVPVDRRVLFSLSAKF